jgi:hypothetical protein
MTESEGIISAPAGLRPGARQLRLPDFISAPAVSARQSMEQGDQEGQAEEHDRDEEDR